mmetsp:Transcript_7087/g.25238  ORF Transcript_7087/g.25238 Transcript_7087/m.25238 type:complete len:210 (-) Transcript_7087:278-907(-)
MMWQSRLRSAGSARGAARSAAVGVGVVAAVGGGTVEYHAVDHRDAPDLLHEGLHLVWFGADAGDAERHLVGDAAEMAPDLLLDELDRGRGVRHLHAFAFGVALGVVDVVVDLGAHEHVLQLGLLEQADHVEVGLEDGGADHDDAAVEGVQGVVFDVGGLRTACCAVSRRVDENHLRQARQAVPGEFERRLADARFRVAVHGVAADVRVS